VQSERVEITESQYLRIADCLPRQRGNVSMTNLQLLNALLYVAEHGCKWRGLPRHLGNWHTIYTRMNRWSKAGVLDRVFARLQQEQIIAKSKSSPSELNTSCWTARQSKRIPTVPGL
jgi:transposase